MIIIVVVESKFDQDNADDVKGIIEQELPMYGFDGVPVGIATDEDVRQEDIVGYLHWEANNAK